MAMDFIKIKGYKSIKNIQLDLAPINIFIGANGAGKSNFLTFFEFLSNLYQRKLTQYVNLKGGANKLLFNGAKNTDEIRFEISFDQEQNGYSVRIKNGGENFVFQDEYLLYQGKKSWNIANHATEAAIKTTDNFRAKHVINYLNSYRKYHFHDTAKSSPFTQMAHTENDSYFLYSEGENISAFLYHIHENHKKVYNRIVKTIQSIAPFFADFYFNPNPNNYIRLQWISKFSDTIYGPNDLSDGTIRFIALTTLFLQPEPPSSIIIDEPELGLHPFAIAKLAGMIKSAAARDIQVILATQSSDLVNHFLPEDIITVDLVNGESQFNRLDSQELERWLEDYGLGELWQRNILSSGQPNK
ncbi:AAA family ATPase [Saprospira grandis]|nr:AAA family ATPase [Saprospira grandis]